MKAFYVIAFLIASFCTVVAFNHAPESTGVGARSYALQDVADTVTSSTTTVATDLTFAIAANQKVHATYYVPITLGGTAPGIKFLVNAPASPTAYSSSLTLFTDPGDSLALVSVISSEAAQGVTLASAGNHLARFDVTITNGSTAGSVVLEFAQNVSDAAATIVQRGAYVEVVKL
jgi:hypothetical protein